MGKMGQKWSTAVNTEIPRALPNVSPGPPGFLFRIPTLPPILILGWGEEPGGMDLLSQHAGGQGQKVA